MVEFKAYRGRALRIAVGMIVLVLVMPGGAEATMFIRNDATGGDCTSFGTWSAATMTCIMTTDLNEGIQIDSNGVTLDGNGHTITGNGGTGVFLSGRSGVTIKNINTKNNAIGINLASSNNNILSGNNATSNSNSGINMAGSSNNILSNNNASSNNGYGISMGNSNNNILSNNNFSNENIGIYMSWSSNNTLNSNDAWNNIASGHAGIYLFLSSNNTLNNNNASNNSGGGIYLSQSSNSTLSGNNASSNGFGITLSTSSDSTLSGNTANSNNNYGISLSSSSNNNKLSGNNATSNGNSGIHMAVSKNNILSNNNANSNYNYGISLSSSSNNALSSNNASKNNYGIYIYYSSNDNTLSGNNASKNNYGIYLYNSRNNTLKGNHVNSNNNYGIYLFYTPPYSYSNNIYNNYFNNTINYGSSTGNATWNTSKTSVANIIGGPYLGGNFWANPGSTGFSQTCPDADGDGLCNSIYTLDSYNIDYLPLSLNFSIDNISPASITNLTNITYAPTYINWTWTNPPDPDFNHTELYLNGTFITNILAPQNYYNVTGLTPDTEYELGTHTVDGSGNINETWVNKTASTASISGTKYSISLASGWNLISAPLNLTSWELGEEAVVGNPLNVTPANSLTSIYQYNTTSGLFEKCDHFDDWGWWQATGSESFTELEPGKGYWVMAKNNCNLTFIGTVPSDMNVALDTGWNLIGWYSMEEALLGDEAVVGNPLNVTPENSLTSIYRYNTSTELFEKSDHFNNWGWWPATGSENFIKLEPGRGYWVTAQNEAVWRHES